jgi:hypothetical protein
MRWIYRWPLADLLRIVSLLALHEQSGSTSELLTAKGLLQGGDGNVRPRQIDDRVREWLDERE